MPMCTSDGPRSYTAACGVESHVYEAGRPTSSAASRAVTRLAIVVASASRARALQTLARPSSFQRSGEPGTERIRSTMGTMITTGTDVVSFLKGQHEEVK